MLCLIHNDNYSGATAAPTPSKSLRRGPGVRLNASSSSGVLSQSLSYFNAHTELPLMSYNNMCDKL